MPETLLIVEDDADLARALSWAARKEGYAVRVARTGREALEAAFSPPHPDLVLLDLMLPEMPGTEVCRRLKADPRTERVPIVMVTARGEEVDRVVGFELGADDYVVKPFSTRELLLRVRAHLRRAPAIPASVVSSGDLRADAASWRAWAGEDELQLTVLEFRLLHALVSAPGRIRSREALIDAVWGAGTALEARTVDTLVKRLRRKLGPAGQRLQTVRGVGYRLDPPQSGSIS
ncbi:MAG: response regulator transcription factor [Deltaproteobacteria bacterium]|nr:response regulator transcription factor [Deltaproteobacteria bacterium]